MRQVKKPDEPKMRLCKTGSNCVFAFLFPQSRKPICYFVLYSATIAWHIWPVHTERTQTNHCDMTLIAGDASPLEASRAYAISLRFTREAK